MENQKIKGFPSYERYKDSGIDWIGKTPEHWALLRLSSFFKERRKVVSDEDFPPLSVTMKGIVPQLDNAAKSQDGNNRRLVHKGDFVINSRSDRKGSSGVSPHDGSVSLINIVLEPLGIFPDYVNYLLKSYTFIEEYYRIGRGIVADLWTTRYSEMKNIIISFPPLAEQTSIAKFLDDKTAQIDRAIAMKEEQIKLLNERKQIMIQEAVTKGLDPTVPMKDSGIEWIGEIPEHWIVKRIKYLNQIISGVAIPSELFISNSDSVIRVIKIANIQTMKMDWSDESYIDIKYLNRYKQFIVNEGDLVFALTRPIISTGIKAAIVENGQYLLNQRNAVLKPFQEEDILWFYYIFLTYDFIKNFEKLIDITGQQPNISPLDVVNIHIPLPPKEEKRRIIDFLDKNTLIIIQSIESIQNQIQALKEYKTTLINEAVTGKIKVN